VRHMQMRVVVALHQQVRVAPEVAPVVLVRETGRRDPCPGGQRPDRGLLVVVQWPVDCQEFVVLVLAHCPSSSWWKGCARKLESSPRWKNRYPSIDSWSTCAAQPRPLTWSPSSTPSQVKSTPGRPS